LALARREHREDGEDQRAESAGTDLDDEALGRSHLSAEFAAERRELRPHFLALGAELSFHAIEALVDLIETLIDLIETLIDVIEARVDVTSEVVEPIVGPAAPHRLHLATLADKKLRRVRECVQMCNETR
jgi:hypothetical protein